jgi:tRNA (guanine10-N2)-dimethyltransferase
MEGFIFLTGEHPELALAEVRGALRALGKSMELQTPDERIVLTELSLPPGLARRMGFSHFTGGPVTITNSSLPSIMDRVGSILEKVSSNIDISVLVKVPSGKFDFSSSDLFSAVENAIRTRGLKLRYAQPDRTMFIIVRESAYIGWIEQWTERNTAKLRRGSKMPFNRPVMMDPRLARVLVNLSGISPDSLVLDPFLGPGGLAIEAAHLGLKVIGVEMDPIICEGARKNVAHQGLSDRIRIIEGDSREFSSLAGSLDIKKIDGIITDPPFGRSAGTMGKDPEELLVEVLRNAEDLVIPGSRLVLDSSSPDVLKKLPGYELDRRFEIRVHKSMTRNIGVLTKV